MTILFKGKKYTLISDAQAENYGTTGEVRYYARAIDDEGDEYLVCWQTTVEWENANRFALLSSRLEELTEKEHNEYCELYEIPLCSIDDESNACKWEYPISATPV